MRGCEHKLLLKLFIDRRGVACHLEPDFALQFCRICYGINDDSPAFLVLLPRTRRQFGSRGGRG